MNCHLFWLRSHFQWDPWLTEAEWRIYMCPCNIPTLLQIMACRLFGANPLSEPMLPYCQLDPKQCISVKFHLKFKSFHSRNCPSNTIGEMAAILSLPQCVKSSRSLSVKRKICLSLFPAHYKTVPQSLWFCKPFHSWPKSSSSKTQGNTFDTYTK